MKGFCLVITLFYAVVGLFGQQPNKVMCVETDKLSMVFTASEGEKVIFQYFGDKLSTGLSIFPEKKFGWHADTQQGSAPDMFPANGGGNFLKPAILLTHEDGVITTELKYNSFQQNKIDDNVTEFIIGLKDRIYPVFVDIHFKAYSKENVICQRIVIHHKEKNGLKVEQLASAYLPLHSQSYYLTHFSGTWAAEMHQTEEKLTPGIKMIESRKGVRTTQSESPSFLLSLDGPAKENSGEIYAGALAWSGNYQLTFELDEYGLLNIQGGINPFASTYHLNAGESFSTPEMIWTYSSCGKGQVSRNYHDWCRKYSLMHGDQLRPVVLNSWEGAYFSFNEQTIIEMIDHAADFGIEMFVLDDGWFGNEFPRNNDKNGLGDWQTNTKKLPRGINYLAEHAVNKGLKFGIWIEPEMVNPDSKLAQKHPEWVVKSGKRELLTMRNQWLLDLSNPRVQDFVVQTFDEVLALSPHISYIKWDANRHVDNVGSEYLASDRQTHFWIDYVKGLYSVYERIRAEHPDIMIQLCSSGGGRLDFGALRYHDEFWASDNTSPLNRIFIQHGTNIFFPAIATASHVSTSPNHQTGAVTPLKFRFDVAMSERLGMELQPKDIVGSDRAFAINAIEIYKRIRPIIQFGDLYRLVSPYQEGGWAASMYVTKEKKEAVVFAYSIDFHERTKFFECKLNGLDARKQYKIEELNTIGTRKNFWGNDKIFTGEELMKVGINLDISALFDSAIFLLTEV